MVVNDAIVQEVLYKDTVAQEVLYMNYLSVRPLVLSNTLSHIWDRLNLPMLLFKEGLLTLMSNKPLTPVQRSVLAKGPNFAVTPRQPPNLEYITAIEAACTKLSQQDAGELRADVNRVLRSSHPPKPNLTKAQNIALRELKRDRDCIVLTADKGVAMVVMDKQDYINKVNQLLNQNTYKVIAKDPTTTIKINSLTYLRL